MSNRCALVTGSSSGIGKAISGRLLEAGYKVIGIARDHSKFNPDEPNYHPFTADLSDFKQSNEIVTKIIQQHSDVDILVSNAGQGCFQSLENFSTNQIREFLDLNLTTHILICQRLVKHFKKGVGGNIIIMGSEAALRGKRKATLYSAAKFGLRGFSQALSDEVSASNIRVSLINPGAVRTPFFDKLGFQPGDDDTNAIEASDVAEVAVNIIESRQQTLLEEVNMAPAKKVIKFHKTKI